MKKPDIYTEPLYINACDNGVVSSNLYFDGGGKICFSADYMGKKFDFSRDDANGNNWKMYVAGNRTEPLVSFNERPQEKDVVNVVKHFANVSESTTNLSLVVPAKLGQDDVDGFLIIPIDAQMLAQLQVLQQTSGMTGDMATLAKDLHGTRELTAFAVKKDVAEKIYSRFQSGGVALIPTEMISKIGMSSYMTLRAEYNNGQGAFVDASTSKTCAAIPDVATTQACHMTYVDKHGLGVEQHSELSDKYVQERKAVQGDNEEARDEQSSALNM